MEIPKDQIIRKIYPRPLDELKVYINFYQDRVWLSLKDIATLYNVQILTIKKHLRNAYKKGKLDEKRITAQMVDKNIPGSSKTVYNLEAILNIGHRINSELPIKFEKWLSERLNA
ncbi:hypothetical protein HYV12_02085 [Candidatus Dojkabacteria bacterium]|nr:hypothetical protein [Candidatus Dojkabacteria bacterium]